jgi:GNAT superfamily N-acetyltransferase
LKEDVEDTMTLTEDRTSTAAGLVPNWYPTDLERQVVSLGGMTYRLRPIRPDDDERLVEFHNHLSQRSCYLRFFTFHPTLSRTEVERFTCVDYLNRLALVALLDDRIIAVGRYDQQPGTTHAEVAFVVADEFQHHGIGSLLLDELARMAWRRGIHVFNAETLHENRAMLDVFHHSGFPVSSSIEYGTVTVRLSIEATEAYKCALAKRESTRSATVPIRPQPD